MRLTDLRRLTGASLILDRPGAAGEAAGLPDAVSGPVLTLWRRFARTLLDAVGWSAENIAVRPYPGGASLAITAPVDGLYAATDLIERAWDMTQAALDGGTVDQSTIVADLTRSIGSEAVGLNLGLFVNIDVPSAAGAGQRSYPLVRARKSSIAASESWTSGSSGSTFFPKAFDSAIDPPGVVVHPVAAGSCLRDPAHPADSPTRAMAA